MKQDNRRPLFDHWLWEWQMLTVFVSIAIMISVVVCAVLFSFIGTDALWTLIFAVAFGPGYAILYGLVGKRMSRLADAVPQDEGPAIQGLIVRNIIESAGIIVLSRDALILQPIAGKRSEVKRSELTSVREVTWFNGQRLFGKTGFWFKVPGFSRLACAVPNSRADDFRAWLSEEKVVLMSNRTPEIEK